VKSPIDAGTLLILADPKKPRRKRKMRSAAALLAKAAPNEKAEERRTEFGYDDGQTRT